MTLDSLPDLDTSGLCLVKTLSPALTCWPYRNMALRDGARTSTRTSAVAKGRTASIHCRPAPPRQTEALSSRTSRSRPLETSQPSGARAKNERSESDTIERRAASENPLRATTINDFAKLGTALGGTPTIVERLPSPHSAEPDQAWVTDITYIPTGEGWLYLAVILDLCSRFVVGWAMSERITDDLTLDALGMALARRRPPAGPAASFGSGQYASGDYQRMLAQH